MCDRVGRFCQAGKTDTNHNSCSTSLSTKGLITRAQHLVRSILRYPTGRMIFAPATAVTLGVVLRNLVGTNAGRICVDPFRRGTIAQALRTFRGRKLVRIRGLTMSTSVRCRLRHVGCRFSRVRPSLIIMDRTDGIFKIVTPTRTVFGLTGGRSTCSMLSVTRATKLISYSLKSGICSFTIFTKRGALCNPAKVSNFIVGPSVSLPTAVCNKAKCSSTGRSVPTSLPRGCRVKAVGVYKVTKLCTSLY